MTHNREREIWWLFVVKGMAPSQIDRKLGMFDGIAHDRIVARWKWDRENHSERKDS